MNNIIILDDDLFVGKYVKKILKQFELDCSVQQFSSSQALFSNLNEGGIDVLILDFYLENETALDLLPKIRKNDILSTIPVMIVTGVTDSQIIKVKTLEAGADSLITKPFQAPEFIAQLRALLRLRFIEKQLMEKQHKLTEVLKNQSYLLKKSNERWKLFLETTNDGIWEWNITTGVLDVSEQWKRTFGYANIFSMEQIYEIIHPDDVQKAKYELNRYLRKKSNTFRIEIRMQDNRGVYKWQLCRGQAVWNSKGKPYRMVGTQTDITDKKEMETRLRVLAHHDPLTGLPNRILVRDRANIALQRAAREKQYVGFLFLDLDGFKGVNDTYGHAAGDVLLKQVSSRISSILRKFDTLARIGGDEFLIVLSNVKRLEIFDIIGKRCLESVSSPYIIENNSVHISTSIGISYYPKNGKEFAELTECADKAMYYAKNNGKNKICYYNEKSVLGKTRNKVKKEQIAVALKNDEIKQYVQPIYDVDKDAIIGFETLLRWFSKDGKQILPSEFIYLAEEIGMMGVINEWVMSSFIRFLEDETCFYNFHINLLPTEFFDQKFLRNCERFKEKLKGKNATFCFEITENAIMQNISAALKIIRRAKTMGYQICIDNFGTGYFSLQYLTELGINYIKMDRHFVKSVQTDTRQKSLWKAIIEMGNRLNISTIAVGVETESDMISMQQMGIQLMQGNYFGIPNEIDYYKELCKE